MSSARNRNKLKPKASASSAATAAKLVAVKQEPVAGADGKDSLAYLIEDRVELIKQIFAMLDSKTIKAMAPDSMSGFSADSLQEYCLDELLGISNKRLLSIIDETKCPTDTEDSDSDVENLEEHISLEEISSDEEAAPPSRSRAARRTKNARDGRGGAGGATAATAKGPKQPMTMLELLELQYRAAAIRSQLALEPVTKIELDSDSEAKSSGNKAPASGGGNSVPTVAPPVAVTPVAATSSSATKPATNGQQQPTVSAAPVVAPVRVAPSAPPKPRPVRLKRNFRQRQDENYEPSSGEEETSTAIAAVNNTEDSATTTAVQSNGGSTETTSAAPETVDKISEQPAVADYQPEATAAQESEIPVETATEVASDAAPPATLTETVTAEPEPLAAQRAERSPSPDIVPIVASPPTFCISSESEGEEAEGRKQRAGNYINMPSGAGLNRPVTEDEIFLRKVKEAAGGATKSKGGLSVTIVQQVTTISAETVPVVAVPVVVAEMPAPPVEAPQSDPEEGELSDDDVPMPEVAAAPVVAVEPADISLTISEEGDVPTAAAATSSKTVHEASKSIAAPAASSSSDSSSSSSSSEDSSDDEAATADGQPPKIKTEVIALTFTTPDVIDIEDDDEDIIDLGKDVIDDFDVDAQATTATAAVAKGDDAPKDQEAADDSWGNRWARSKKVSKVIATARLGSKLRSKIKQNKERSATAAATAAAEAAAEVARVAAEAVRKAAEASQEVATMEEGSVEQYSKIVGTAKPPSTAN